MTQDVFGHGTEQQLAQPGTAMRADDNQVNFVFIDDARQVLPDLAVANVAAVGNVGKTQRQALEVVLGLGNGIVVDGTHAHVVDAAGHHHQTGIGEDVHHVHGAAKTATDGGRVRQGRFRCRGEICGKENVLKREGGLLSRQGVLILLGECHRTPPALMVRINLTGRWRVCRLSRFFVI
jgi:hypothetical protein